jgi:c-di-GMP-binding flagellar brake protein YcgR
MFHRRLTSRNSSARMGEAGSESPCAGNTENLWRKLWLLIRDNVYLSGSAKQTKPRIKGLEKTVSVSQQSSFAELGNISGEVDMDKVIMLHTDESCEVLRGVIEKKVPAIMSYLSRDKWHVAKVLVTDISGGKMTIESIHSDEKQRPINIRIGQPVGISFKHAYGKFIFDTIVVALEPSTDSTHGGTMIVDAPTRIGVVDRRSYFRVNVPESLKVNVVLWHRSQKPDIVTEQPYNYYQGKLIDISAGGAQVILPSQDEGPIDQPHLPKPDFKKGQFIGLRFTPMPYETPLMFNAQIRNILPTVDKQNLCLGLQIVGLEVSPEGRKVLSRIAAVVERYYQINQAGAKQQDLNSSTKVATNSSAISAPTKEVN